MESQEQPTRPVDAQSGGQNAHAAGLYFLTLRTTDDGPWLGAPRTRDVFLAVLRAWNGERSGRILAVTVMPDHAHILLELGGSLTIRQVVERWKSTIRKGAGYAETLQEEYGEHRLRGDETVEDYALFSFLHPYRSKLCPADQTWPGWWSPVPASFQFTASLNDKGCPPPEWIAWPAKRFAGLTHGE